MRFNIGDIVKIAKNSEYYGHHADYNPKDTEGKITHCYISNNPHCISVKWDNECRASYRENDLRLVRRG